MKEVTRAPRLEHAVETSVDSNVKYYAVLMLRVELDNGRTFADCNPLRFMPWTPLNLPPPKSTPPPTGLLHPTIEWFLRRDLDSREKANFYTPARCDAKASAFGKWLATNLVGHSRSMQLG